MYVCVYVCIIYVSFFLLIQHFLKENALQKFIHKCIYLFKENALQRFLYSCIYVFKEHA